MSAESKTPRLRGIQVYLLEKYPYDRNEAALDGGKSKLLYYMEAAELFGQECCQLETELAAANARIAELEARIRTDNSEVIANLQGAIAMAGLKVADLEAENKTLRAAQKACEFCDKEAELHIAALQRKLDPMPIETAMQMINEWYDADETGYKLIRRVEAWHEQR